MLWIFVEFKTDYSLKFDDAKTNNCFYCDRKVDLEALGHCPLSSNSRSPPPSDDMRTIQSQFNKVKSKQITNHK